MGKKLVLILLLVTLGWNINLPAKGHAGEEFFYAVEIKDGSTLNMKDCVALAFKNSPQIKRKKYELDIAKSNLGVAKSRYFPVISAGAGFYNENNSNRDYYEHYYRELPNVGVTINKMVWDFGRTTAYIKMEEFYKLGAEYEFIDSLCKTLFEIKIQYYNLLKAKALLEIERKNVELCELYVENAREDADLTTAKLNLSAAKTALMEAQTGVYNAQIDLSNSMYLDNQTEYDIINTPTFNYNEEFSNEYKKYHFSFSRDEAVQLAYDSSPDLMVLISTRDAMEQSLKFIKKTYLPELNANAGYGFNNTNMSSNNSFYVGVNLDSSVNLMELKHSIKGADAQINLAENEITLFKKDLYYEVKRSFNNFDKAERQISVSQLGAKQAKENLELVEKAYKNGRLNYVALQDARKDYINASTNYVDTMYNYNLALIGIEMAMHYHIADIHHKAEHAMSYHSESLINHLNEALGCSENEQSQKKTKKRKHDL